MSKVQVRIKTPFGEITIENENTQEVLRTLENFPEGFMEKVSELVSTRLTPSGVQLKGIVE